MTMTNVTLEGKDNQITEAMFIANIHTNRAEASEMHLDRTVTVWIAITEQEQEVLEAQGIKVNRS